MLETVPIVVIPAFNEEGSIRGVVQDCLAISSCVVVVDDGSSDGTRARAIESGATVISHARNLGVGSALLTGFRYAERQRFSAVVQVDGDGQHPANAAMEVYSTLLREEADLAIGSRFLRDPSYEISKVRQVGISLLRNSVKNRTGLRMTDPSSGLRAFSPRLVGALSRYFPDHYLGDTYEVLCAASRAGYHCTEVGVTMKHREFGSSSASGILATAQVVRSVVSVHTGLGFRLDQV